MHARHERWDAATRVAEKSGDARAVAALHARRGAALEARRAFAEAEKAYAAANRHDLAVAMVEKNRLFDHRLRVLRQGASSRQAQA